MTGGHTRGFSSGRMLAIHQRAAWIPNDPGVPWHHFIRSRFIGRLPDRGRDASLAVVVHTVTQQSETHAELRGMMEYTVDASLPVLFEFAGSLALDTREISLQEVHLHQPGRECTGHYSENGRVMTLRLISGGGNPSKTFSLIHEGTLALLSGDGS